MNKLQNLLILLFLFAQLSCVKEETQEPINFEFVGTFNGQPFNFSDNNLVLEKREDPATKKIDHYIQKSIFGNPISGFKGLSFHFYFGETNVSYKWFKTMEGQQLLHRTTKPFLLVLVNNEGKKFDAGYGKNLDNECQVDEVKLIKQDEMIGAFNTSRIIAVKGYLKILSYENTIKGHFTLKLAEGDY